MNPPKSVVHATPAPTCTFFQSIRSANESRRVSMRILVLAAALGAVAIPSTSASAQSWGGYRDYRGDRNEIRQERRECRRELRRADTRREYRRELRECRRELREARRDYRYDSRRYGPPYGNA
jgi:hypothetical protein